MVSALAAGRLRRLLFGHAIEFHMMKFRLKTDNLLLDVFQRPLIVLGLGYNL
jgi:hypothetical protein